MGSNLKVTHSLAHNVAVTLQRSTLLRSANGTTATSDYESHIKSGILMGTCRLASSRRV